MNNEADDIMDIYGQTAAKVFVPNVEQEFSQKCKKESTGLINKYFSRTPQNNNINTVTESENIPLQNNNIINESQQKNILLNDAIINLQKVLPYFSEDQDKKYLKEIKEAIEELMV